MTILTLDRHVKRLQAAGLSVDEAVAQVSALMGQVETKFAAQRDLKAMEVALEEVVQDMEGKLRRHIEKLAVSTERDFQDLEAVTRCDLHDLEARLDSKFKDLDDRFGLKP